MLTALCLFLWVFIHKKTQKLQKNHKQKSSKKFRAFFSNYRVWSVSRVLYLAVIYLGAALPIRSSDTGETANNRIFSHHLVPNGVYMCPPRCRSGGELLPRLSTLTLLLRRFISVALSLESPPPVVSRHFVLRYSDFPR